jgi:hypothetical protein
MLALALLGTLVKTASADPNTDTVVARVNGKPIYAKELEANLPPDAFAVTQDDIRTAKLAWLIENEATRQFLQSKKIVIADKTVDDAIAEYRKIPPPASCSCCRYGSLQEFLDVNGYTLMEFRENVRNTKGMDVYLEQQWKKKYPTKTSRDELVNRHRDHVMKYFARMHHIFFNVFQQMKFKGYPSDVEEKEKQKAIAAWNRLEHGESFEAVAKAVSEDVQSRSAGGALGCIDTRSYGDEVRAAILQTKAGTYTKPIASPFGFHILKWEKMSETDIANVVKQQLIEQARQDTSNDIMDKAKIDRYAK